MPRRTRRGFILLELVISVAVFAVTIGPALQSSLAAQRLNTQALETQRAVRLLNNARYLLHGATIGELTSLGGSFAPGQAMALPAMLDDQIVTYRLPDWVPGDPLPEVLSMRIQLDWTSETDHARSLFLVDAQR